jgi:hypothetical protein
VSVTDRGYLLEALLVLAGAACLLAACGQTPAPVEPWVPASVVEVETVARGCLDGMPPWPRPAPEAAELEDCGEPWAACLRPAAAVALDRWLRLLILWAEEVTAICSRPPPIPDPEPNQGDRP